MEIWADQHTVKSFLDDKRVLARKKRTEIWRQVNLHSSKYDLELEKTCCRVSY